MPASFVHYKVNVPEIDDAHWDLLSTMRLINQFGAEHNIEQVKLLTGRLGDKLKLHQAYEESLMESAGYLYLNSHKNAHREVESRLAEFQSAVNRNLAYSHMADSMMDMLRHHIDEIDRQSFEWMAAHPHQSE